MGAYKVNDGLGPGYVYAVVLTIDVYLLGMGEFHVSDGCIIQCWSSTNLAIGAYEHNDGAY